jgi:A/G-specific adenine glycosylase
VFAARLVAWQRSYGRHDLPWQGTRDPYRVWLAEIMLQQTQVATVIPYYARFLDRCPDIAALAAAPLEDVMALWSGLGYYRRARMLHAAAKLVVKEHGGRFPDSSPALRQLPGIGRYTAAAIASIAHAEPTAVVDGNVERVLARLLGKNLNGETTWKAAEELLDRARPGDFNQAMMELGATVCLPREPKCLLCPVSEFCVARGDMPRTSKPVPQTKRQIHFGLARRNGEVFLRQRSRTESLMPGMWELPSLPGDENGRALFSLRHSITVTDYKVHVMELARPDAHAGNWIAGSRLTSLPLTGLARKILRKAEML